MQPVVSTPSNTCWAFVAGEAEPRHLSDIIFGVYALRARGVPDSSIFVFTDHPASAQHLAPFGITQVATTRAVTTDLARPSGFEVLVIVVTGHGDHVGISVAGGTSINPTELLAAARSCPGTKAGVIILGQCFAGVFNYTDAGLDRSKIPLCLVGATNLNPSLSSSLTLPSAIQPTNGAGNPLLEWQANIFLAHFFQWLMDPRDVDGDARCTLTDAYKHSGVMANQDLRTQKRRCQHQIAEIQAQLTLPSDSPMPQVLLAIAALRRRLDDTYEVLYLHQEPWVLNSVFAKEIEFSRPARAAITVAPTATTTVPGGQPVVPAAAPAPAPAAAAATTGAAAPAPAGVQGPPSPPAATPGTP